MPPRDFNDEDAFDLGAIREHQSGLDEQATHKAAKKEATRQRENAAVATRRQAPAGIPESRPNSMFQQVSGEGPGNQMRLFGPQHEPEAFETTWEKRARTERRPVPARTWAQVRPTSAAPNPQTGKRQGVSQESVRSTLAEQGVTTQGAKARLRSHWHSAVKRAPEGEMPAGQDFYAREQADRIGQDAKYFGVPFHVALAVNAVMSPKTALATPSGLQTNREAAHMVMQHVTAGRPGTPPTGGRGLRANAAKGADIVRQHLASGTHPLDATDENGKHLVSGPKVEEYYASYLDPSRSPTDIQHSRILFGPKVRSELSPEEIETKNKLIEQYGKNSPEVGRHIPKTPAEQLLAKSGVHEWASHVTSQVAAEMGVHPSEFQSVDWHEHKTRRGGRSAVQQEVQPMFVSRAKPKGRQPKQGQLPGVIKASTQFKHLG